MSAVTTQTGGRKERFLNKEVAKISKRVPLFYQALSLFKSYGLLIVFWTTSLFFVISCSNPSLRPLVELVPLTCTPLFLFGVAFRSYDLSLLCDLLFKIRLCDLLWSLFRQRAATLFQFRVAFRGSKIRFFDQDRIQKFAFNRLVFADVSDDSIDGHGHLLEREFDRAG